MTDEEAIKTVFGSDAGWAVETLGEAQSALYARALLQLRDDLARRISTVFPDTPDFPAAHPDETDDDLNTCQPRLTGTRHSLALATRASAKASAPSRRKARP